MRVQNFAAAMCLPGWIGAALVIAAAALACVPAPAQSGQPAARRLPTLTGCSGKSIEAYGITRDVYGTWMGRSAWRNLANGDWMSTEESGLPQWRRDHFDRATDVGVPLIPTDSGQDYNDLLKEAASGAQDATYRSLGGHLAGYATKTVFARLWWEFNMPPAHEDPALFVAAWRRAVPLIRAGFQDAAGPGQTLSIVWCTNAGAPDPEPFYPGDDVVDIIGSDTYGMVWGSSDPTVAQMITHLRTGPYMLEWLAEFANQHGKPTCQGEWANVAQKGSKPDDSHGAGDCPQYIDAIYAWMKTCRFGCRYVCYYNLDTGGVGITLDQTPAALARLKIRAAQAGRGKLSAPLSAKLPSTP